MNTHSIRSPRECLYAWLLIGSFLPLCWLLMLAAHELGHVAGAWMTGGRVSRVVVHPLTISRTDLAQNPHPLFVAWAGPVLGVIGPVLTFAVFQTARLPGTPLVRFFAGFCLVANGAYLGAGSFGGVGDAGTILAHGGARWALWAFGAVTVPAGLWLWHRLGTHFGIGPDAQPVRALTAFGVLGSFVLLVVLEVLFSG